MEFCYNIFVTTLNRAMPSIFSGGIAWQLGISIVADAGLGLGAQVVSSVSVSALSTTEISTALSSVTVSSLLYFLE